MKPRDDTEVASWLAAVDEDLRIARLAIDQHPPIVGPVCFHAQQAAEKAMKALLVAAESDVPRTHDLVALVKLLVPVFPEAASLRESAARLAPYAVSTRYPVLRAAADPQEACDTLRLSETIVTWVLGTLT